MIRLENNHPLLQLASKVEEASAVFFKEHNLNYFQYLRCYRDGRIGLLLNDPSLFLRFTHLDAPVVFSSLKEDHVKMQSYWFLWDEELPREPIMLAKEDHSWHHGLTLVKRHHDYYDMIAVAMPQDCSNASSYYMNRVQAIEQFMTSFHKHAPELFESMEQHSIFLPEINRDINYQSMCIENEKRYSFGDVYITPQELKCLTLKLQGSSYKEIANIYQLSPRTVETYLNRIKCRSGINSKNKLQELILQCK